MSFQFKCAFGIESSRYRGRGSGPCLPLSHPPPIKKKMAVEIGDISFMLVPSRPPPPHPVGVFDSATEKVKIILGLWLFIAVCFFQNCNLSFQISSLTRRSVIGLFWRKIQNAPSSSLNYEGFRFFVDVIEHFTNRK